MATSGPWCSTHRYTGPRIRFGEAYLMQFAQPRALAAARARLPPAGTVTKFTRRPRQGHAATVALLLLHGFNPKDLDRDGNTCSHLAAAGGDLETFKLVCMQGLDLSTRNTLGNTVIDMASTPAVAALARRALEQRMCDSCGSPFGEGQHRFLCATTKAFLHEHCSTKEITVVDADSEEARPLRYSRCVAATRPPSQVGARLLHAPTHALHTPPAAGQSHPYAHPRPGRRTRGGSRRPVQSRCGGYDTAGSCNCRGRKPRRLCHCAPRWPEA